MVAPMEARGRARDDNPDRTSARRNVGFVQDVCAAAVIFFFSCSEPGVYLIGGCLSRSSARPFCTMSAANIHRMEAKTIAREVISARPHPPGSNCAARRVKENRRLCEETVKPWEHCGSDNFNW